VRRTIGVRIEKTKRTKRKKSKILTRSASWSRISFACCSTHKSHKDEMTLQSSKKHWAQSDLLLGCIRFAAEKNSQRGEGKDKQKAYKVGMVEYNSVCSLQRCQGLPQRAAGDEVAVPKVRDGVDHHKLQITF
jgi:hypothetical protein